MIPLRTSRRLAPLVAALGLGLGAGPAGAIEMFTYFGDGSRIGLPSLEVPIEAYPGIPLRSDRIRARRRALRAGPGAAAPVGPPTMPRSITIRAMPSLPPEAGVQTLDAAPDAPLPPPAPEPEPVPPPAE